MNFTVPTEFLNTELRNVVMSRIVSAKITVAQCTTLNSVFNLSFSFGLMNANSHRHQQMLRQGEISYYLSKSEEEIL